MKKSIPQQNRQHTIAGPIHFVGRGLHSGRPVSMTLHPAPANSGYRFRRLDVTSAHQEVQARWLSVTDTRLSTTISNSAGVSVKTVEHLLAALAACEVDNCRIDIDGPEVPIMDGSAKPFVEQILATGLQSQANERMAIVITEPLWIEENGARAGLLPFPSPWIEMAIDFESDLIGRQKVAIPLTRQHFVDHICAARTFGFAEQIATLKQLGLARGGNLHNAILVNQGRIENSEGLRFDNEFVRHKVVDAIGDLSLLGVPIVGCFVGDRSGHRLNNQLLRKLMFKQEGWLYTSCREAIDNWEQIMLQPEATARSDMRFPVYAQQDA